MIILPKPILKSDLKSLQIMNSKEKLADILIKKYNITEIDLSNKNTMKSILREIQINEII